MSEDTEKYQHGFTTEEWEAAKAAILAKREKELERHLSNDWTFYGRAGVLRVKALPNGQFSYSAKGESCGHGVGGIIGAFMKYEQIGPEWEGEPGETSTEAMAPASYEIRARAIEMFGEATDGA